jgi:hypothetical protein
MLADFAANHQRPPQHHHINLEATPKGKVFDSALLPGEGVTEEAEHPAENPRQAYCVLALDDKEGCPAVSATQAAVPDTISSNAGTVLADVDPQGQPTTYVIEYGTTAEYGHTTTAATVANENGKQSETVALSGLEPCTTYHYQAEAENAANEGTPGLGGDQTFKTAGCPPPTVVTDSAVGPYEYDGGWALTYAGTVNPNGLPTSYGWQYRCTLSGQPCVSKEEEIGKEPPWPEPISFEGSIEEGTSAVMESTTFYTDPCSSPPYEVRMVAESSAGTSYGPYQEVHMSGPCRLGR